MLFCPAAASARRSFVNLSLLAALALPLAAQSYLLVELEQLTGLSDAKGVELNSDGAFAGYRLIENRRYGFVWQRGKVTPLTPLGSDIYAESWFANN